MKSSEDRFPGDGPTKRELPEPYNLDLSQVLTHLKPKTPAARAESANDPLTAAFLASAKRLLDQHLGPGGHCRCTSRHDNLSLLGILSQRNLVDSLTGIPEPFPKRATQSVLRNRWEHHSDFIADLVAFIIWEEVFRPGYPAFREAVAARLTTDENFVDTVHEVAYLHTDTGAELTSVRLSLALMILAEDDEHIARATREAYSTYLEPWKTLYEQVMLARGLRLRAGLTLDMLVDALSVVNDGVTLRAIVNPADVLDHDHQRSLTGTITLAVLNSFLERADRSDGLTLEQAVADHLLA